MTTRREKGEKYRPVVMILKTKKDVPTVLKIGGRIYTLEHASEFKRT